MFAPNPIEKMDRLPQWMFRWVSSFAQMLQVLPGRFHVHGQCRPMSQDQLIKLPFWSIHIHVNTSRNQPASHTTNHPWAWEELHIYIVNCLWFSDPDAGNWKWSGMYLFSHCFCGLLVDAPLLERRRGPSLLHLRQSTRFARPVDRANSLRGPDGLVLEEK